MAIVKKNIDRYETAPFLHLILGEMPGMEATIHLKGDTPENQIPYFLEGEYDDEAGTITLRLVEAE